MEMNYSKFFNFQNILRKKKLYKKDTVLSTNQFSTVLDRNSESFKDFKIKFNNKFQDESIQVQKAVAVFLGNLIGDAFGAFTEFLDLDEQRPQLIKQFSDIQTFYYQKRKNQTPIGGHTDVYLNNYFLKDCSQAKCLAESILSNPEDAVDLNGLDCRLRYILWLDYGYCNGLKGLPSFGLGGNTNKSLYSFVKNDVPKPFVDLNQRDTNGCGSIMRLAPCTICAFDNLEKTIRFCAQSSLTTHDGLEAEECCKLLGLIIFTGCNSQEKGIQLKKWLLENIGKLYEVYRNKQCDSIKYLANGLQEDFETFQKANYPKQFNQDIGDRNWQWKEPQLFIAQARKKRIDYYGSYCMDCLYIALHIVWNTNSFKEALIKAANFGGDCDSFGAVVGQICGAIYGLDDEIMKLYFEKPVQYDEFHAPYLAYRLVKKQYVENALVFYNSKQQKDLFNEVNESKPEEQKQNKQKQNYIKKEQNEASKIQHEVNQQTQKKQNQINKKGKSEIQIEGNIFEEEKK